MAGALRTFSSAFVAFVRQGGYAARPEGDALMIASEPGGEIRFYVSHDADRFWSLSRAERTEDEQPIMCSADWVNVELMLTMLIGGDVRSTLGPSLLKVPLDPEDVASDIDIISTPCGFTLSTLSNTWFAAVSGGRSAARFSVLIGHTPESLRAALLNPTGAPLFRLRQPCRP